MICICNIDMHMQYWYAYAILICICNIDIHVQYWCAYAIMICICNIDMHMQYWYAYVILICNIEKHLQYLCANAIMICICNNDMHMQYWYAYAICMHAWKCKHEVVNVGQIEGVQFLRFPTPRWGGGLKLYIFVLNGENKLLKWSTFEMAAWWSQELCDVWAAETKLQNLLWISHEIM